MRPELLAALTGRRRRLSPLAVGGCALWLPAWNSTRDLVNGTAPGIGDMSSAARHFSQVGAASTQPLYTATGGPNGRPYVTLGGARWWDSLSAAASWNFLHQGGCDFYAVLRSNGANPNDITGILSTTATTANGVIFGCDDRTASSMNDRVGIAVQAATGTLPFTYATSANNVLPAQSWRVVQWSVATTGVNVRVAGTSVISGALAAAPSAGDATTTAKIGRCPPAYTFGALYDVADLFAFQRAASTNLSAIEREQVSRYLLQEYGLVG